MDVLQGLFSQFGIPSMSHGAAVQQIMQAQQANLMAQEAAAPRFSNPWLQGARTVGMQLAGNLGAQAPQQEAMLPDHDFRLAEAVSNRLLQTQQHPEFQNLSVEDQNLAALRIVMEESFRHGDVERGTAAMQQLQSLMNQFRGEAQEASLSDISIREGNRRLNQGEFSQWINPSTGQRIDISRDNPDAESALAAAGWNQVTPVARQDVYNRQTREEAFADLLNPRYVEEIAERTQDARYFSDQVIPNIDMMRSALDSGEFRTGAFAGLRLPIGRVFEFFDMEVPPIIGNPVAGEILHSQAANLGVNIANNMSRLTNMGLEFVQNSLPRIGFTEEGNRLLLDFLEFGAQRALEIERLQSDYLRRHGHPVPTDPNIPSLNEVIFDYKEARRESDRLEWERRFNDLANRTTVDPVRGWSGIVDTTASAVRGLPGGTTQGTMPSIPSQYQGIITQDEWDRMTPDERRLFLD